MVGAVVVAVVVRERRVAELAHRVVQRRDREPQEGVALGRQARTTVTRSG